MKSLGKCYPSSFYAQPTVKVARELLGAVLCRRLPDKTVLRAEIVEVEAYHEEEPACHAHRGRTPRSTILFGPPGLAYVYFIYGMYSCLNVVTEAEGVGAAVLIRAAAAPGTDGPGKLCREWQISREQNGINLMSPRSEIWIEQADQIPDDAVLITPRIGISSAQDLLWRFCVAGHPSVSVKNYKPHKPLKRRTKSERRWMTRAMSKPLLLLNWFFCIAWMAVIYYMSDVPNSFHVTEHYLGGLNFFVRKWAHMGEYFMLTVLLYRALRAQISSSGGSGAGMWFVYSLALGGAIFYAVTDEYHQAHVAGRSSSVGDVAVDSAGAMLALAVLLIRARTDA